MTKIISGLIMFVFVVSLFQFALPAKAEILNSDLTVNIQELYNNPNQNAKDGAYKFSLKVLKSGIIQNVIGCTGVVNKVSTWMAKLMQSPNQQKKMLKAQIEKTKTQMKNTCAAVKGSMEAMMGSYPGLTLVKSIDTAIEKVKYCEQTVDAQSDKTIEELTAIQEQAAATSLKEQCFDGIAITLARNQLTSMTRSAMNWVNTGYGGNPFFVQNLGNFTANLENNVIETGIDVLLAPGNKSPYATDFARSTIVSRGIGQSSAGFLGNLQSTLGSFLTNSSSYYTNDQLDQANETKMAYQRAVDANNAFANDFSVGGWGGWLALTQQDQNNPLGFTMIASQYLADEQAQKVSDVKDELAQNNGFLSQKTCILWQVYGDDGKPKYEPGGFSASGLAKSSFVPITQDSEPANGLGKCVDWKITTPGSIIRDKTTNYLNSPERQLELAKTINDGLNALFAVLISKLEEGGLSGLSSEAVTTNWTDDLNNLSSNSTSLDGNTPYDNNGAYDNFNLTRDLGNTYIHTTPTYLGTWNAATNIISPVTARAALTDENGNSVGSGSIKLYSNLAPEAYDGNGKTISSVNSYYTVKVAGKTSLIVDGYNNWAVGDRAFWNGSEWQNWKCYKPTATNKSGPCDNQINPIKKRGVVQIQQDYIVAAKEILGVLPNIMTNLGELDYCIPGPNPSYKTNSTNTQSAYQDWVGSMYVGPIDSTGNRHGVKVDKAGSRTYDNLHNIFADNPNVWTKILGDPNAVYPTGMQFILKAFSNICSNTGWENFWDGVFDKGDDGVCDGNYFYAKNPTNKQVGYLQAKTDLMNLNSDYVNESLFQNFYEVFDKMMNKLYFKNITSKYLESENKFLNIEEDKNPGYIPMAESGLDLTKNIMYYAEDIAKVTQEYNDAIATAKVNIAKLEPIKMEVSGIIKAAQARRDANLIKTLNKENTDKIKPADLDKNGTITEGEYKKYYTSCLEEENIKFYDSDGIIEMGNANEEGCYDQIDNDLDGLVDMKDPDCFNSIISNTCKDSKDNDGDKLIDGNDPDCKSGGVGQEVNDNTNIDTRSCIASNDGRSIQKTDQREGDPHCVDITTKNECETYWEYDREPMGAYQDMASEWRCVWE